MKQTLAWVVAFVVSVGISVSCSGKVGVTPSNDAATAGECVPGAEISCPCAGETRMGVQACTADGQGYGACAGCSAVGSTGDAGHDATGGKTHDDAGLDATRGGGDAGMDATRAPDGAGVTDATRGADATESADATQSTDAHESTDGTAPLDAKQGTDAKESSDGGCPFAASDTIDHDGDGWSNAEGDCNDCNKYINPGAYDIPGDGIDQDCDGTPDDEPTGCDSALTSVATTAGTDGAQAMDLCRTAPTDGTALPLLTWGVVSAGYVLPDGTTTQAGDANFELGFGILGPSFGTSNSAQQGTHVLGLSSGSARQPTDPGYQDVSGFDKGYTSGAPSGFPGQTPACGAVTFGQPHDGAALQLVIRVPTNALTMSFDSNFFSYEFPDWVCSTYNDTYVVIMTPSPSGEPIALNSNIANDGSGNSISINASFLSVCQPTTTAGMDGTGPMAGSYAYACSEGPAKLLGTGFGIDTTNNPKGDDQNHASTDWLTTTVSVADLAGKDITLLFAIWDSSDGYLDSTVLIDNVHWTFATTPNMTIPPPLPPTTGPTG